jgi:hypothetical protein
MPKEEPKKKVVIVEEVETVDETPKHEEVDVVESSEAKKVEVIEDSKPVEQEIEAVEEYDKPNYLWIIVPTALLVGALVGGLITYFSGIANLNSPSTESPTPVATTMSENKETPVASSSPTLKRDGLKVQVLNGSGVSGAAGKAKTLLEGLGYVSVETGNASSSSVETTEVAVKETAKEYLELIIKDLSKEYEATAAAKVLPTSSKYDIVVTLGKK